MAASAVSPEGTLNDDALLRSLERERFAALVADDWEAFQTLCDPRLRYTHTTGTVDSLASYVARGLSGHYDYQNVDYDITRISIEGDVALVFATMRCDMVAGGVRKRLDNVTLAVWIRQGTSWRLIAYQPTAVRRPVAAAQREEPSS